MSDLFDETDKPAKKAAPKKAAAKKPAAKKSASKGKSSSGSADDYSAKDIEVLEGLEPVRHRPGMYIGGTDEQALHHLAAEVLDNSMDEAVAGYANKISIHLEQGNRLTISDNGRGIPIDPHPKYKKPALEVILTTLHSGGKFTNKAYETSGGLHGVGISVVNALAIEMMVEVARDKTQWRQTFSQGKPTSDLKKIGSAPNKRGTSVTFVPDQVIFGDSCTFKPARLWRMARSKAYLFRGVEIHWSCDPALVEGTKTPADDVFHFPGGLSDFLNATLEGRTRVVEPVFADRVETKQGTVEWALAFTATGEPMVSSYCNTIPTPDGGTHVQGMRAALLKGLRAYGELTGNRKAKDVTIDDLMAYTAAMLSVFIPNPEFQGQTKEKLSTQSAVRLTETAMRDHFDHWLSGSPKEASQLLEWLIDRAEERRREKADKEVSRKQATRKLRLPGKLADCSQGNSQGTELFLVEGESAGGSAKQARNRGTQAVLPLRGKILNVASASRDKIRQNQELSDLIQALGVGLREKYKEGDLRYDKVIIMTDADVDGAHIASLLMTFFFQELPQLVKDGHLYLGIPPLYKITQGGKTAYARDDAHKDELLESEFKGRGKVDIGRFKGLGEMMPAQLKETTMNPATRTLLRVDLPDEDEAAKRTKARVDQLMGKKPEARFQFIQENAAFVTDVDL